MPFEPGDYYFILAPQHDELPKPESELKPEPEDKHEHKLEALTAGKDIGEYIMIKPHAEPYLGLQLWRVTPVEDEKFYIESLAIPERWLGYARVEEDEPLVMRNEPVPIWVYFHPTPGGEGHWMLRIPHDDPKPVVVARRRPDAKYVLNLAFFYNQEGEIDGAHMDPTRVSSDNVLVCGS
ncbi:hypothetical protein CTheo_4990 [Ceratobasidium theobromae]|uniref:Uncharacterized protein n=1 Tax=Ceratobasidium theobromae TaxID=1582974 RepID=A0A5N5QJC3_9AGAM|nr:hypothetical protein CTheo_4990 [Ceratobasidium theobromae]